MSRRGFTLIELLVVIAIIGILAAMVLASLGSARSKARDASRKNDLAQIRSALEQYGSDNGGSFPPATVKQGWSQANGLAAGPSAGSNGFGDATALATATPPGAMTILKNGGYLSTIPAPQRANSEMYGYQTNASTTSLGATVDGWPATAVAVNTQYLLEARLEKPADGTKPIWQVKSIGTSSEVVSPGALSLP